MTQAEKAKAYDDLVEGMQYARNHASTSPEPIESFFFYLKGWNASNKQVYDILDGVHK